MNKEQKRIKKLEEYLWFIISSILKGINKKWVEELIEELEPEIEITVKVNGQDAKLSDISQETLDMIRTME